MHFDALTTAAVGDELRLRLAGGRVDRIFQPTPWSLALLLYSLGKNWQLLISVDPRVARVHLATERKLASGFSEPTMFVMLLRKHLESARLQSITQPPLDRLLELEFRHGTSEPRTLVIELLGRQSNLVLLDHERVVLGVFRPVTQEMSRTRVLLTRHPYAGPPPAVAGERARLDPRSVQGAELWAAVDQFRAAGGAGVADQQLPRVLAISPTVAREALFRAGLEDVNSPDAAELLASAIRELFAPLNGHTAWQPSLVGPASKPLAFAPYALRSYASTAAVTHMESISLAVERYFAPREATDVLEQRRSRLRTIVKSILDRAERKLTALIKQREDARADLALRTHGELLLTYQPNFEPGQTSVTLHDYVADQAVKIAVDARLSAVANAQRLFDRYAKAKRAGEALKPQIDATQLDVEFGRQALTDVSLCDSAGELVRLEAELGEAGYLERRQQAGLKRKGAARPGERKGQRKPVAAGSEPESLKIDGFEVLFGKSSLTNDHLTFRVAAKQDVWLHAKGVPGSHVVVRSAGRQPPPGVVHQAAALAAYLSASRGAAKADVDWTAVANVRRQPGAKPGLVYYDGERTLVVAPQAPTALVPASQEGSSEHERSR